MIKASSFYEMLIEMKLEIMSLFISNINLVNIQNDINQDQMCVSPQLCNK